MLIKMYHNCFFDFLVKVFMRNIEYNFQISDNLAIKYLTKFKTLIKNICVIRLSFFFFF